MYKRIIAVLDESEESLAVVEEACLIAHVHGSESVALVTVMSERQASKSSKLDLEADASRSTRCVSSAVACLDALGILNEVVLLNGNPAREIGRYALETGAELLVVGSRYFGKVAKSVGSPMKAAAAGHKVKCPVLVVKGRNAGKQSSGKKIDSWANTQEGSGSAYERIAVAVDGAVESLRAAQEACKLARVHASNTVSIVSVIPMLVYSDSDYDPAREHGEQQMGLVLPVIGMFDKASINSEAVLLHGRPADEIARYVDETGVDLLIMGTRSLSRIHAALLGGSVSRKVAMQTKCPVLLVG